MSRHRVRNIDYDYDDDYDDYDDDDYYDEYDDTPAPPKPAVNTAQAAPKKNTKKKNNNTTNNNNNNTSTSKNNNSKTPTKPENNNNENAKTPTTNKVFTTPTTTPTPTPTKTNLPPITSPPPPPTPTPTPPTSPKQNSENLPKSAGQGTVRIVVIGHVDAGKSTVVGHLMVKLGFVDKKILHKNIKDSEAIGKKSFHFAWVLDETETERNRGVTVNCAHRTFSTPTAKAKWCIVDAPGHRDFIPNMISGSVMADVAVLVVDARLGEFETGFGHGGQTREHALLVRSLGVRRVVVVVNKMDAVHWDQLRFESVTSQLKAFLTSRGWKEKNITCVPVSALSGQNLTTPIDDPAAAWYTDGTLLQVFETLEPSRDINSDKIRSFVMEVTDKGASLVIESGLLKSESSLVALPANVQFTVKSITNHANERITTAHVGDTVSVTLNPVDAIPDALSVGTVLCDPTALAPIVKTFEGHVVTANLAIPLIPGMKVMLHLHFLATEATITKLVATLDKNGEVKQKRPRCIPKETAAIIEVTASKGVCVDVCNSQTKTTLGRFTLRDKGHSVAMGIVTKLL